MSKQNSIRPLRGAAFLEFLKTTAEITDAWPPWMMGERWVTNAETQTSSQPTRKRKKARQTAAASKRHP